SVIVEPQVPDPCLLEPRRRPKDVPYLLPDLDHEVPLVSCFATLLLHATRDEQRAVAKGRTYPCWIGPGSGKNVSSSLMEGIPTTRTSTSPRAAWTTPGPISTQA